MENTKLISRSRKPPSKTLAWTLLPKLNEFFSFLLREWVYYSFEVEENHRQISFETSVSSGDIELYISTNAKRPNNTAQVMIYFFHNFS